MRTLNAALVLALVLITVKCQDYRTDDENVDNPDGFFSAFVAKVNSLFDSLRPYDDSPETNISLDGGTKAIQEDVSLGESNGTLVRNKRDDEVECKEEEDCGDNGICNEKNFCECKEGYKGEDCKVVIGCDEIEEDCKSADAICVFDKPGNPKCQCNNRKLTYVDNKCVIECKKEEDCGNNGVCNDKNFCECKEGYKGEYCKVVIGCDEMEEECRRADAICVFDRPGNPKCQCNNRKLTYVDNKCVKVAANCTEEYPMCEETKGLCIIREAGVECICPSGATYQNDTGCTVTPAACGNMFPKCNETKGTCIINNQGNVECHCSEDDELDTYVQNVGCKLKDEQCKEDIPECFETRGYCTMNDEDDISCVCPNNTRLTERMGCKVLDDKCNGTLSNCIKTGGACKLNQKLEMQCLCPDTTVDKENKGCRSPCNPSDPEKMCKHGGRCEEIGEGQFCKCMKGTSGSYCEVVDDCKKTNFCGGNSECYFDEVTRAAGCNCTKSMVYNVTNKTCEAIDKCLLRYIRNECNKPHEVCKSGNCTCVEPYKYSEGGKSCVEDLCARCPKDVATCDIKDGVCKCKNGYFDGKECVKGDLCLTLGKRCHSCDPDTGECFCEPGFEPVNNSSCKEKKKDDSCTLDCKPGSCVKKSKTMNCVCPGATHITKDDKCVDKCTANQGKAPEGLTCPTSECEKDPKYVFRCKCDSPYEQAEDGIHCKRKKMCEEEEAIEKCDKISAECRESETKKEGYECFCGNGFEMDNTTHTCKRKCDLDKYKTQCAREMGECQLDSNYDVVCECPPPLTKGVSGTCNTIAKNSYMGVMTLLKSKYEVTVSNGRQKRSSDLIDSIRLLEDLKESVKYVYGDFQDVKLESCDPSDDILSCQIEMQLKKKTNVNVITTPLYCYPINDDFCAVGQKLILKREQETEIFQPTNPCKPGVIEKLCEDATECSRGRGSNFNCTCKDGFSRIGFYNPFTDKDTFIEKCNDIDECIQYPSICPSTTYCINLVGSYTCICKDGYKKINETSSPKVDGCKAICDPNPCENDGECVKVGSHHFSCKCKPLYAGVLCNETVSAKPLQADHKSAAIVGGVLGTLLVIILIVAIVLYRKMNKTKGEDEDDEYPRQRQRGLWSEISRARSRPQDDNPGRDLELRNHERVARLQRRDSGEFRRESSADRIIPRVQVPRSSNRGAGNDQERIEISEEPPRKSYSREDRNYRAKHQYTNKIYEED